MCDGSLGALKTQRERYFLVQHLHSKQTRLKKENLEIITSKLPIAEASKLDIWIHVKELKFCINNTECVFLFCNTRVRSSLASIVRFVNSRFPSW